MSTSERICSDCKIPVDDRGCSRCWWKTPLPKVIKRTSLTVHAGGGGVAPPRVSTIRRIPHGATALLQADSLVFDFGPYTFQQGSTVLIAITCPQINYNTVLTPDVRFTFAWGSSSFISPLGTSPVELNYFTHHATMCAGYDVPAGTNNLVFTGDLELTEVDIMVVEVVGLTASPLVDFEEPAELASALTSVENDITLTPAAGKDSFVWAVLQTDNGANHGAWTTPSLSPQLTLTQGLTIGTQVVSETFMTEGYAFPNEVGSHYMKRGGFDASTLTFPKISLRGA